MATSNRFCRLNQACDCTSMHRRAQPSSGPPAISVGEAMRVIDKGEMRARKQARKENARIRKVLGTQVAPEVSFLELDDGDSDDGLVLGNLNKTQEASGEWEQFRAIVDSGAEDNALPEVIGTWLPLEPSQASKAGKHFNGPGGEKIYAKGRRITPGITSEGQKRRISWEVCPVKKPLLSVVRLNDAGSKVTMQKNRAYITNVKGEITHLRRVRNTWVLDLWIKRPAGFTRQAP